MTQPFIVVSFAYARSRRHLVWAESHSMAAAWVATLDRDAGREESPGYTVYTIVPQQDGTVVNLEDTDDYDPDALENMFGRGRPIVLK